MTTLDEKLYRDLVGDAWESRYRDRFAELAAGGPKLGWNAEAAWTPMWGFKRQIPVFRGLVLLFPIIGIVATNFLGLVWGYVLPIVITGVIYGVFGDWLYYVHLRGVLTTAAQQSDATRRERVLKRARVDEGALHIFATVITLAFTALLIMASVPPEPHDKHRQPVATVKADLRNLVTAQDAFFMDSSRFTLMLPPAYYSSSTDVTVHVLYADSTSWGAEGRYEGVGVRCEIFVGRAVGLRLATMDGEPACEGGTSERH